MPLAVKACKEAWDTLMSYCADATDAKSEAACKHYREDPADFLVSRVLRANINPIDGGYRCVPHRPPGHPGTASVGAPSGLGVLLQRGPSARRGHRGQRHAGADAVRHALQSAAECAGAGGASNW